MTFSLATTGDHLERAEHYLEYADKFRLGDLPTEMSHEKTRELSSWAKEDTDRAISSIKEIDVEALESLLAKTDELEELKQAMQKTLDAGHKVFFSGCGATGRLSLKLEFLWRSMYPERENQVVGFMAGGDVALIRSIESFEDHFDFGERQLLELGFVDGDLLVAITEGGETSFVIGTAEAAAKYSKNQPFFLYCNPDDILNEKVERSRRVLANEKIKSICLAFGPMALSGSTRMQATTVQLMAVAAGLLQDKEESLTAYIQNFIDILKKEDFSFLKEFIYKESETYVSGEHVVYSTDDFGITILTDTTERSPTFSLAPFENFEEMGVSPSLCYFHIMKTNAASVAWHKLLLRIPRTLAWEQYLHIAGEQKIKGYDFSDMVFDKREKTCGPQEQFSIYRKSDEIISWRFVGHEHDLHWGQYPLFYQHLLLKLALNIHSTTIMGRLNRYEGNWMTWVKPSNGKLIDRAIRYIQGLAKKKGHDFSYEVVAKQVFKDMDTSSHDKPIVLQVLHSLLN